MGNWRSGRKTKAEEKAAAIEEITEQALLKLARSKVRKHLDKELTFQETKEMALPIVVKGMAQKLGNDPDNPLPAPVLVKFINGNEPENNKDTDRVQEVV